MARSTPELKAAFEQGLEEILSAKGGDRKEAIVQTAAMIGGVILARAVLDPRLSDEILQECPTIAPLIALANRNNVTSRNPCGRLLLTSD